MKYSSAIEKLKSKGLVLKSIVKRIKQHVTESLKSDDFPLMFMAGLAVGTAVMLYISKFGVHLSEDHIRWAEFGSYIGGVLGATFAFLAFVILLQTLKVNQKELSDTRAVIQKQNFESSFMQLLNQTDVEHSKIKIDVRRESLRALRNSIESFIIARNEAGPSISDMVDRVILNEHVHLVIKPYIDFLQIFLEFISENVDVETANHLHIKLFVSKLSDDYLIVLISSIFSKKGNNKLRKAVIDCELVTFIQHETSRLNMQVLIDAASS